MLKPLIYAELLSNIRQISVVAALDTPCDASTSVELSADGKKVILHHRGATSSLNLPGQVAPSCLLQKPVLGSKDLSWRLALSDPPSRPNAEAAVCTDAPWPATDLEEGSDFSCRSCNAPVLKQAVIKGWRDLPSENWAEMMDFWHCHKPDVPASNGNGHDGHSHGDHNASKGYGANTKFTAQPGIAFVDLTTFLVSQSDCPGVEVSYFFTSSFSVYLSFHVQLGIKKATKLCICDSVAWSPIQIPYIDTFISIRSRSYLPFSLKHGLDDRLEDKTSAFHSVSSSRSWKATGSVRDICRLCSN